MKHRSVFRAVALWVHGSLIPADQYDLPAAIVSFDYFQKINHFFAPCASCQMTILLNVRVSKANFQMRVFNHGSGLVRKQISFHKTTHHTGIDPDDGALLVSQSHGSRKLATHPMAGRWSQANGDLDVPGSAGAIRIGKTRFLSKTHRLLRP